THLNLREARENLKRQKAETESLVHILSHDLMNPISAMLGFIHLAAMLPSYDDPDTQELWKNLEIAANQQESIVSHVREMRALETGKKKVPLTPVNLADVIDTSMAIFQARLKVKEITLQLTLDRTDNWGVKAEPVSLTHNVVSNLISNAIKFSFPGSTISIEAKNEGGFVHLIIEDKGIGIPPSILPNLFKTDVPTSRPGTSRETGTGFGMPLVKKYVDVYQGEIQVESRAQEDFPQDHGTRICLSLKPAPLKK
ncbi:MAG: HAMP domain-containing histidine kinase, partial [Deltaproteobacteria bacterium]|nr:HAMP domain-containing histidine kinase [Deltaproteobacteria bacterium]